MKATYLDTILAWHRNGVDSVDTSEWRSSELLERARTCPPTRDFAASLSGPGLAVIGEIKRRSPSKGDLGLDLDPAGLAGQYAAGGASALSVLTDAKFFGGGPDDLTQARNATSLPVLRKDFTVCAADVCEARLMGADALLLIVAALSEVELIDFLALSRTIGVAALTEVHDEAELAAAVDAGAEIIGVNQRDLVTFEVDSERAHRLAGLIPSGVLKVAESGISGPDPARRLYEAGYDAVLVGESLVTAPDPARAMTDLVRAGAGGRLACS
ncbi:MAG: indole-3-glycerol phosphate synthase TrpC [Acidimicrobiales bacterium]